MRIIVKQRGGFAGMDVDLAKVDTAMLDAPTRAALEQKVRTVLASAAASGSHIGADQLEYELTVDGEGGRRVATWVEDGTDATAPIRELVGEIKRSGDQEAR